MSEPGGTGGLRRNGSGITNKSKLCWRKESDKGPYVNVKRPSWKSANKLILIRYEGATTLPANLLKPNGTRLLRPPSRPNGAIDNS